MFCQGFAVVLCQDPRRPTVYEIVRLGRVAVDVCRMFERFSGATLRIRRRTGANSAPSYLIASL